MWYTGQTTHASAIGDARSIDAVCFVRVQTDPVILPQLKWDGTFGMCPHVLWDDPRRVFRVWYSGGKQYEPDLIGYAESSDGMNWSRRSARVFVAASEGSWDGAKVATCQVIQRDGDCLMFDIGFKDIAMAAIGMARSSNGLENWERFSKNPILKRSPGECDGDACSKPFALKASTNILNRSGSKFCITSII
jgi:hypothetical protein